jgi:NB-ARC domain
MRVVAVTGAGGSGKSTLAARACVDSAVRKRFPDGITWLEAGPRKDPVALLADLARRLGLPREEIGFTTVEQGCDLLAAGLRGKRVLIALDNVWDRKPLDAVIGLAPSCVVMFTTRLPGLSTIFSAARVEVGELTPGQALEALLLFP